MSNRRISRRLKRIPGNVAAIIVLLVVLIVVLFPIFIVWINSFKTEAEIANFGPLSFPKSIDFSVLRSAWIKGSFGIKFWNSLVISGLVTGISVIVSIFNGYVLGIGRIRRASLVLFYFLFGMMIPVESIIYPLYYFLRVIGLYDTRLAVALVISSMDLAFGTYFMTSVFRAFPKSYVEAAKIDGCSNLVLLSRIVVPLNLPALFAIMVFFFIWSWNDMFISLIFIVSSVKYPMPLGLLFFSGEWVRYASLTAAGATIVSIPSIIYFVIFQRNLVKGITAGGMVE